MKTTVGFVQWKTFYRALMMIQNGCLDFLFSHLIEKTLTNNLCRCIVEVLNRNSQFFLKENVHYVTVIDCRCLFVCECS